MRTKNSRTCTGTFRKKNSKMSEHRDNGNKIAYHITDVMFRIYLQFHGSSNLFLYTMFTWSSPASLLFMCYNQYRPKSTNKTITLLIKVSDTCESATIFVVFFKYILQILLKLLSILTLFYVPQIDLTTILQYCLE